MDSLHGTRLCRECIFAAVHQLADKSLLWIEQDERGVSYRVPHTVRAYMQQVSPPDAASPVA
ncbi:hypothetical protein ACFSHR_00670 [Azotobacter chroococcum]